MRDVRQQPVEGESLDVHGLAEPSASVTPHCWHRFSSLMDNSFVADSVHPVPEETAGKGYRLFAGPTDHFQNISEIRAIRGLSRLDACVNRTAAQGFGGAAFCCPNICAAIFIPICIMALCCSWDFLNCSNCVGV